MANVAPFSCPDERVALEAQHAVLVGLGRPQGRVARAAVVDGLGVEEVLREGEGLALADAPQIEALLDDHLGDALAPRVRAALGAAAHAREDRRRELGVEEPEAQEATREKLTSAASDSLAGHWNSIRG